MNKLKALFESEHIEDVLIGISLIQDMNWEQLYDFFRDIKMNIEYMGSPWYFKVKQYTIYLNRSFREYTLGMYCDVTYKNITP